MKHENNPLKPVASVGSSALLGHGWKFVCSETIEPDRITTIHNGNKITVEREDAELWIQGMDVARAARQSGQHEQSKQPPPPPSQI